MAIATSYDYISHDLLLLATHIHNALHIRLGPYVNLLTFSIHPKSEGDCHHIFAACTLLGVYGCS